MFAAHAPRASHNEVGACSDLPNIHAPPAHTLCNASNAGRKELACSLRTKHFIFTSRNIAATAVYLPRRRLDYPVFNFRLGVEHNTESNPHAVVTPRKAFLPPRCGSLSTEFSEGALNPTRKERVRLLHTSVLRPFSVRPFLCAALSVPTSSLEWTSNIARNCATSNSTDAWVAARPALKTSSCRKTAATISSRPY